MVGFKPEEIIEIRKGGANFDPKLNALARLVKSTAQTNAIGTCEGGWLPISDIKKVLNHKEHGIAMISLFSIALFFGSRVHDMRIGATIREAW